MVRGDNLAEQSFRLEPSTPKPNENAYGSTLAKDFPNKNNYYKAPKTTGHKVNESLWNEVLIYKLQSKKDKSGDKRLEQFLQNARAEENRDQQKIYNDRMHRRKIRMQSIEGRVEKRNQLQLVSGQQTDLRNFRLTLTDDTMNEVPSSTFLALSPNTLCRPRTQLISHSGGSENMEGKSVAERELESAGILQKNRHFYANSCTGSQLKRPSWEDLFYVPDHMKNLIIHRDGNLAAEKMIRQKMKDEDKKLFMKQWALYRAREEGIDALRARRKANERFGSRPHTYRDRGSGSMHDRNGSEAPVTARGRSSGFTSNVTLRQGDRHHACYESHEFIGLHGVCKHLSAPPKLEDMVSTPREILEEQVARILDGHKKVPVKIEDSTLEENVYYEEERDEAADMSAHMEDFQLKLEKFQREEVMRRKQAQVEPKTSQDSERGRSPPRRIVVSRQKRGRGNQGRLRPLQEGDGMIAQTFKPQPPHGSPLSSTNNPRKSLTLLVPAPTS